MLVAWYIGTVYLAPGGRIIVGGKVVTGGKRLEAVLRAF